MSVAGTRCMCSRRHRCQQTVRTELGAWFNCVPWGAKVRHPPPATMRTQTTLLLSSLAVLCSASPNPSKSALHLGSQPAAQFPVEIPPLESNRHAGSAQQPTNSWYDDGRLFIEQNGLICTQCTASRRLTIDHLNRRACLISRAPQL
jgi:hypothetical protein